MSKSNNKRPLDTDRPLRFVGDRSVERSSFLEAIQTKAPEVLMELYQVAFPLHEQSCKNTARQPEPREQSDACWDAKRDIQTWQAAWDWAARFQLARGMELDLLKQKEGIELACWFMNQAMWRRKRQQRLPAEFNFPFTINQSPELTFGIPLMLTVWDTLDAWLKNRPQVDALSWNLLPPGKAISESLTYEQFIRIQKLPLAFKSIAPYLGPPPHTYEFGTLAWNVVDQSKAQAKARIMKELERQLEQKLKDHEREVRTKPYFEQRPPEKRDTEHYELLVLYQVKDMNYSQVAREVLAPESHSTFDTAEASPATHVHASAKPQEDADTLKTERARITDGIKSAAEQLIGPLVKRWLRPGRPGAPGKRR